MLDLQRASAGSGKTYALTKYFIRFLISVRHEEDDRYRLRRDDEIPQALGRILAITFTNKATNEMQMRIVEKLDALAKYEEGMKKPDYLDDFIRELGASQEKIAHAADVALRTLLNNYSDFNVSTIDSFFQSVLRTFVYESNLTDNYQVELESGYVSRMGLNTVLDEVDSPSHDRDIDETRQWLRLIMNNEDGSKWNVFQKSESSGAHAQTPYSSLLGKFSNIDSEEYRRIRGPLDEYLESDVDLIEVYRKFENTYQSPKRNAFRTLSSEAGKLQKLIVNPDYQKGRTDVAKPYMLATKIISACKWNKACDVKFPDEQFWSKKTISAASKELPELWDAIRNQTERVENAYNIWYGAVTDPDAKLWEVLRVSFPFLGLLKSVSRKRKEYLEENESIELAETSMLLNAIIGPSDTPFVYERMGNYLDHLLIDEFQDTSELQWKNLKPLLEESLGRGNDNLIIGDAKQSIYRFRNADYELINTRVPRELNASVNVKGNTPDENTNWRSDRRIVEWNNNLFHYIVNMMGEVVARGDDAKMAVADKFKGLYGNVKQTVHKEAGGYVEVVLNSGGKDCDGSRSVEEKAYDLIVDALERGYGPKDICVLARGNKDCDEMARCLMRHNAEKGSAKQIEFVSEQSLLVGNSVAVSQVVTVLQAIAHDMQPELNSPEKRPDKGPGNIRVLESHLILYRQMHPELSMAECMARFTEEDPDLEGIRDMLGKMQTLALPALVEAIVSNFVMDPIRQADAPYLAAFQDIVLEYCEGHPADLPSFLSWWDRAKGAKAISSPEDADAVRIMTSHKSKGLEFPVVIVTSPVSSKTRFGDCVSGKEWIWVNREDLAFNDNEMSDKLPPYIPVNVTSALEGTVLENKLYENYDLETVDSLNLLYVTFTRAVNELYIFTNAPAKTRKAGSSSLGELIMDFVGYWKEGRSASEDFEPGILVEKDEGDGIIVTYGEKPDHKVLKGENKENCLPEKKILDDYKSVMVHGNIRMREVSLPSYSDDEEADEEDDSRDPRSVGNVCHAVMENVVTFGDLAREIKRMEISGLVPQGSDFLVKLKERVTASDGNVERWFSGIASRVVSERPVLRKGAKMNRPDRIMFFEDGGVEIVDYKFGKRNKDSERRHRRQVENYVRYLKQVGYRNVIGWLWYVFEQNPADRIVEVSR